QGLAAARARFDAGKTAFDEAIAAAEHAFYMAVNKLPAMKGKSVSQLTADYKKVSGEIAKLTPLGGQKAAPEAKLIELGQERANLLERLAKARSRRWTALGKAVKDLNK